MKIPKHLKHKPVIVLENYDKIDGSYLPEETDAKGLSLGLAQWNDRGNVDISAKVWRFTGEKWSRQSEEMPLHRVLDLAILICKAKQYFSDPSYKKNMGTIGKIELQKSVLNVSVCGENELIASDIDLFKQCLDNEENILDERLRLLSLLLKRLNF